MPSVFYNLNLTGTGIKRLQVNASASNLLDLNDKELATGSFTFSVTNSDTAAIQRTSGFVSSLNGGYLKRTTAMQAEYLFPVGSSIGVMRYRPVSITPGNLQTNDFTVRMVNNDANLDSLWRDSTDGSLCMLNPEYYHIIGRTQGSSPASITIFYDAVNDGNKDAVAAWNTNIWQNAGTVLPVTASSLNGLLFDNWNLAGYTPFILGINAPQAAISGTTHICGGTSTLLTASGGQDYSWNTGDTTNVITVSNSGTYSVTVTSVQGCYDTASVQVFVSPPPLYSLTATNISCYGFSDGSALLSVDSITLPASYQWSNGQQDTTQIGDLQAGTYFVTITDGIGCSYLDSVEINEPDSLQYIEQVNHISCYNYNDGSIDVSVNGGTAPYSFNWDNSDTTAIIQNLSVGSYSLTITDANGCQITVPKVNILEPPQLSYEATIEDVSCHGLSDGNIQLSVSGGTPGYVYSWSNSQTNAIATNLPSNIYYVTVTDANNCDTVIQFTVKQPEAITVADTIINPSCLQNNNGSIAVQPFGGTSPYFYSWSNGVMDSVNTELTGGIYSLTITDTKNCSFETTYTVEPENVECLVIPDIFTPNGDGYNDTWVIENIDLFPDAKVEIYNRWGDIIFESEKGYPTAWDGTWNGKQVPFGSYVYILDLGNGEKPLNGIVTVKR
jgi:gliding motility-associated-like protein